MIEFLSSAHVLTLLSITFLASWVSSVFAMGGGILALGLMSVVVPLELLVPLHALLISMSTVSRSIVYRRSTDWRFVKRCIPGILLGVFIGTHMNLQLPEAILQLLLALLMLQMMWLPSFATITDKQAAIPLLAVLHGTISSAFGTGGVLQSLFARKKMEKYRKIATFSTIMAILTVMKVVAYVFAGVAFGYYWTVVILAIPLAFVGNALGRWCVGLIPDVYFNIIFKAIVSALAFRLLYLAWLGW